MDTLALKNRANQFMTVVQNIEIENASAIRSRQRLEETISQLVANNKENKEALEIAQNAIAVLKQLSDDVVGQAYGFLQENLNTALKRMFKNTIRKIEIKESLLRGQYMQLELILHVGNNKVRSLKTDSGHGIAQIVSLLCILSLIVITNGRRLLVIDEVISGLSVNNRRIVNDILWAFTEIGFQFIVNEHGFIPEGSHVYHLEMNGDVSGVKQHYIAKSGVYLQGGGNEHYTYSQNSSDTESDTMTDTSYDESEALKMSGAQEETTEAVQPEPPKPMVVPNNTIISI